MFRCLDMPLPMHVSLYNNITAYYTKSLALVKFMEEGRERETDSLYSSSLYSSSLYSTYLYSTSLTFTSLYSTSLLTCQGIMSKLLARLLKNWTAVGFHLDSLINNENLDIKESKMKGLRQRKLKMISRSTWRSWRSSQRTWRKSSTLQTNTKGKKEENI